MSRVRLNLCNVDSTSRSDKDCPVGRLGATAILVLVQSIASAWATLNPEFSATTAPDRTTRRLAVIDAVSRLIAPD